MMDALPTYQKGRKKEGVKNQSEVIFDALPLKDQKDIEGFVNSKTNASNKNKSDYRRELIKFRQVIDKPLASVTVEDLEAYMSLVNRSVTSGYTERSIKATVKAFLIWKFPNHLFRFKQFNAIKQKLKPLENRQKDYNKVVTADEVKRMVEAENDIFWKAFLLLQNETGLRTVEVREMKWTDVTLSETDEPSEVKIYSNKTQQTRYAFFKEATPYLKVLKAGSKSEYVFSSPMKPNQPITKASVCLWIKNLSKRVLGEERIVWSYLFRHSKATELYNMADEGKMSEDMAAKLMGHSKSMREVYSHATIEQRKEMMKKKLFGTVELTPEQKNKYDLEIAELKDNLETMKEFVIPLAPMFEKMLEAHKQGKDVTGKINLKFKKGEASKT